MGISRFHVIKATQYTRLKATPKKYRKKATKIYKNIGCCGKSAERRRNVGGPPVDRQWTVGGMLAERRWTVGGTSAE